MFPSDAVESEGRLQFVQNGYYAKEALTTNNTYKAEGPKCPPGVLLKLDPRFTKNPNMLAPEN